MSVDAHLSRAWTALGEPAPSPAEAALPAVVADALGPGRRLLAAIDVARVAEGADLLAAEGLRALPLLRPSMDQEADEAMADVVPYLAELDPDGPLARRLFTARPGVDPRSGTMHLWPANPATLLVTPAPAEAVRDHLRRFAKPPDRRGHRRYVRLWDPVVMVDYLRDIDAVTPFLRALTTGLGAPLTILARQGDAMLRAEATDAPCDVAPEAVLEAPDIRALTLRLRRDFHAELTARVAARFERNGRDVEPERLDRVSWRAMAAMERPRPGDAPTLDDHAKLVGVLMLMQDDAHEDVLTGPVMRNEHIRHRERVEIVARSYVTALRRLAGRDVV